MSFAMLNMPDAAYGASSSGHDTLSERIALNDAMYEQAKTKHTTSTVLSRYQDKYLKDMFETDEKGITSAQQAEVKAKDDEIIAAEKKELNVESLTQYQMLKAFHDWIVDHFYYYAGVNKLSNSYEKEKITAFLGTIRNGKSNGKRINSSYSTAKPATWFASNAKSSKGDGNGRVAAHEIMIATPAIRNLIREGKIHQIDTAIQTGGYLKMQTMDSSLMNLYKKGIIRKEIAISQAYNIDEMKKNLM